MPGVNISHAEKPLHYRLTNQYEKDPTCTDLRGAFHPKRKSTGSLPRYHQVFEQEHGFIAELSILDLICNLGPGSISYLMD